MRVLRDQADRQGRVLPDWPSIARPLSLEGERVAA